VDSKQQKFQKVGYRGYTTHREFGGNRIPVPIQNLMIRDYVGRHRLQFKLGVDEFNFHGCYLRLMSLLEELPYLEGIIMCSLFVLPPEIETRLMVYDKILSHDVTLHLIMENMVIDGFESVNKAEEIIQVTKTLASCPATIPKDLLPPVKGVDSFTH
jgi:sporadic carbohydrate cluster protein (TIGR04323 family)